MKLVIHTQYRENYGAHDWDGNGECPQYWKNKGGETYVFYNVTEAQKEKIDTVGIPHLSMLIEYSNKASSEHIISYNVFPDDEDISEECWYRPWILNYSKQGGWVASRFISADDGWEPGYIGKTESYTLGIGGERSNYRCEYIPL